MSDDDQAIKDVQATFAAFGGDIKAKIAERLQNNRLATADELAALRAELTRLRAKLERAKEVLEPFAVGAGEIESRPNLLAVAFKEDFARASAVLSELSADAPAPTAHAIRTVQRRPFVIDETEK